MGSFSRIGISCREFFALFFFLLLLLPHLEKVGELSRSADMCGFEKKGHTVHPIGSWTGLAEETVFRDNCRDGKIRHCASRIHGRVLMACSIGVGKPYLQYTTPEKIQESARLEGKEGMIAVHHQ